MLEAAFSRGGRPMAKVLFRAWELGCRFDSWREHFSIVRWRQAFADTGIDPAFYANRPMQPDETLPWDHLSAGIKKKFLLAECERSMGTATTPDCREGCLGCGLADVCGGSV
jgi:hypothetical protein